MKNDIKNAEKRLRTAVENMLEKGSTFLNDGGYLGDNELDWVSTSGPVPRGSCLFATFLTFKKVPIYFNDYREAVAIYLNIDIEHAEQLEAGYGNSFTTLRRGVGDGQADRNSPWYKLGKLLRADYFET